MSKAAILSSFIVVSTALSAQNLTNANPLSARAVRECANCHGAQARPHPGTSMAHAMELPAECRILKNHASLKFEDGSYTYRIDRRVDASIYSVSNGQQTLTVPIGWAFGLGVAGQTYVFEKDGEMYESRVSFYESLNGLDLTMGAQNSKPTNLLQAAGRFMGHAEKARCFGCHATNAVIGTSLKTETLIAGVQCERCHGSTENHLTGVKQGDLKLAQLPSLKKMSTEETSNFCGQCHRRWDEIAAGGSLGIASIRFQPYRLTNSKCYDSDDPRIRCTACHDPHNEIVRKESSYDSRCLACHAGGKPSAKTCSVAASNCASCHMPKLEMPGSHHKFTDHQIRVVKANAPYPD